MHDRILSFIISFIRVPTDQAIEELTNKNDELRNQIDEKRKANGSLQSNAHSLELKIKTMEMNEEEIIVRCLDH